MSDHIAIETLLARMARHWPEAATPETDIIFAVIRLHELIRARSETALAPFGLTHAAFEVLVALRAQPHPRQMTPSDLCRSALLTTGGLANLLTDLAQRGLVTRRPNPKDGRSRIVALTPAGAALITRAMAQVMAADRALFDAFPEADRVALRDHLRDVMARIEAPPG